MNNRIDEIRARLDAATPGPWEVVCDTTSDVVGVLDGDYDDADLIAHAPADLAWLIEQYEWMSKERDKVIDWLSDGYGNRVEVEEVLFQFGVINGHLEDRTPWTGTCSCDAKLREECYCGYE